jgi:hypothetical protein
MGSTVANPAFLMLRCKPPVDDAGSAVGRDPEMRGDGGHGNPVPALLDEAQHVALADVGFALGEVAQELPEEERFDDVPRVVAIVARVARRCGDDDAEDAQLEHEFEGTFGAAPVGLVIAPDQATCTRQ